MNRNEAGWPESCAVEGLGETLCVNHGACESGPFCLISSPSHFQGPGLGRQKMVFVRVGAWSEV